MEKIPVKPINPEEAKLSHLKAGTFTKDEETEVAPQLGSANSVA